MAQAAGPLSAADLLILIERKNPQSIRALARRLAVSATTIMAWRDGDAIPSDAHGLTLAALAAVDPVAVLISLAHARTDCPEGRAAWRQVLTEHKRAE